MYACLAVTCHLHFWQNDRDFLRATVVTRGWNGYRNKSQHRKSTLEKKILLPFQQGFEPATFQSRVRCSNHWAIPAPVVVFGEIFIYIVLCGAKLNMVSTQWQFLSTWKVSQLTDENLKNVLKTGSFINAGNMNVSQKVFLIQYSKNLPPNWQSSINPFTVNNFAFWVWGPSKNSMESVWFSWAVWKCCIWELCHR